MLSNETKSERTHDADAVKEFFDQWSLYRRIVDLDYLCHRGVRDTFSEWLSAIDTPFSFLDLGCGDAEFSAGLLRGKRISKYEGVDLSPVALRLAEQNLTASNIPHELHNGDFATVLGSLRSTYDLIYIGLSLHHLLPGEKKAFLAVLRGKLAPDGCLLIYDPVRLSGETRDAYMNRWVAHSEKTWTELAPEELAGAIEHVTSADFPEEIGGLNEMVLGVGFHPAELLYRAPFNFYALMVFRAAG